MSCDRVQAAVSRAMDERRDFTGFERHFVSCPECRDFAAVSVELADRYRRRVDRGLGRLRRGVLPVAAPRPSASAWMVLAAAVLVLLSMPIRRAPEVTPAPPSSASARVPLFDEPAPDPFDSGTLALSGEPPLPRRLDQDLPGPPLDEGDPGVALPAGLRF